MQNNEICNCCCEEKKKSAKILIIRKFHLKNDCYEFDYDKKNHCFMSNLICKN